MHQPILHQVLLTPDSPGFPPSSSRNLAPRLLLPSQLSLQPADVSASASQSSCPPHGSLSSQRPGAGLHLLGHYFLRTIPASSERWLAREASLWCQYSLTTVSQKLRCSTLLGFRASPHSPFRILVLNISSAKVWVFWNLTIPSIASCRHFLQKVRKRLAVLFPLMIHVLPLVAHHIGPWAS